MLSRSNPLRSALYDVVLFPIRRVLIPSISSKTRPRPSIYTPSIRARSASTGPSHGSLSAFLAHAKRTNLDRTSTTFAGTFYEYATQSLLRRYGFELDRVGGRGDRGVDLRGVWKIATEDITAGEEQRKTQLKIPVIIQCKRLKSKVGPNLIRELEGALAGGENTLGVLVGTRGATKGVREAMGRSRVGICWVMLEVGDGKGEKEEGEDKNGEQVNSKEQGMDGVLQSMKAELISRAPSSIQEMPLPSASPPPENTTESPPPQLGRVRQMLWNRAASDMGLEGLDVVMKYDGMRDEDGEVGREVMLIWLGKSVEALDGKDD